jgi:hypothetical protein
MKKHILWLLLAAGPSGCVPQYDIQADTLCSMTKPLRWSTADTQDSIRQMRIANARRAAACKTGGA